MTTNYSKKFVENHHNTGLLPVNNNQLVYTVYYRGTNIIMNYNLLDVRKKTYFIRFVEAVCNLRFGHNSKPTKIHSLFQLK